MRKNQQQHKESSDTIESKKIPEKSELSSLESSESMTDIGLNQNEIGCQEKQDTFSECKDHDCSLLKAMLALSTDFRILSNRFSALEGFIVDWMSGINERMEMDDKRRETGTETVFLASRGTQCPSPLPKNDLDSSDKPITPMKVPNKPEIERDESKCQKTADRKEADEKNRSYADKVSQGKQANQNSRHEKNRSSTANDKNSTKEVKDRNTTRKDDVVRSTQKNIKKEDENKNAKTTNLRHSDDEQVLILSDSVLNGVDEKRLGASYDFHCKIKKCYTNNEIEKTFQDEIFENHVTPTITVLHVGVNDLKKVSPQNASTSLIKSVQAIKKISPKTKVVVSSVAPTSKHDLDVKREAYNALNRAEMIHDDTVSFLCHENLDALSYRFMSKDGIHPTSYGSSVLARNLGRHISNILWKVVLPRSRKPRSNNNYNRSTHRFQGGFKPHIYDLEHVPPQIPLRNRFSPFTR